MELTLDLGKSSLNIHQNVALRHTYTTADKSVVARVPKPPGGSQSVVDHVIALDSSPEQILVVGIGRPSSMFSTRLAERDLDQLRQEYRWVLRQLANNCRNAQTRYGYIQTDQDLVVCRFSKNGRGYNVAIRSIPWSTHGAGVLTTDLALWWLCMLSMSPHMDRAIVNEGSTVNINEWNNIVVNGHILARHHRYSGFQQSFGNSFSNPVF